MSLRKLLPLFGNRLLPSFDLPLNDAGNGAVNLVPARALGSPTPTFTRATAAWTRLSSGLWAAVGIGVARSYYDSNGNMLGYLAEGARTNEALYSRDIGNLSGAWVCTNCTPALNAVGIDGQANACTTLTATAPNATALQTITSASNTARTFSPKVKRGSGTGNIYITIDNGSTWTDVTSSISSGAFAELSRTQTLANPVIGFKIATSGDSIIVDMAGQEPGAFASTPIPTTNQAVQRNADLLAYVAAGNISGTQGAAYAEVTTARPSITQSSPVFVSTYTGATGGIPMAISSAGGVLGLYDNAAYRNSSTVFTPSATVVSKIANAWGANGTVSAINGASSAITGFDGDLNISSTLYIANHGSSNGELFGTMRGMRIYPSTPPTAKLQAITGA